MTSNTSSGALPEGWKIETVAATANGSLFVDGDWVESKDQDPAGKVRLTQLADIGEGEFRNRSDRWMRQDQADKVGVTYLAEGDLLIARMPDPLGRCCQVPKFDSPAVTVVDVAVLRVNPQIVVDKFMMWVLNSPEIRLAMEQLSSGTTRTRISRKNLGLIEIPIPPLSEQEKIVEVLEEQLSRLDAALASVRAVREKSARFRRSLLHTAFTGALTGHDTSDETVPDGWECLSLSDVCLNVSKIDPLDLGREEFKYIDIGSIDSSTNSVSSPQMLKVDNAPGRARQLVRRGDSVFSTVRPYLRNIAYVDENLDGEIASTGFCVIRPNPSKVLPRFIRFFSLSDNLLEQVLPLQRGVSYPAVRDKEVLSTRILVPPLSEQEKIVDILEEQLSRLDASFSVAALIETKASALRRSLLHAAFTGELTKEWREGAHV
jgi:type I restriction enzyme S subunit